MSRTSSSALVPAGVEQVWVTLARFGDISAWGTGVSHSSLLTRGPVGLGSTRRVQVGRNALRETVTDWQPLRSLGYSIAGLPVVVRHATNTWVLAGRGDSTRITLVSEVTTKGGPLLDRLVAGALGTAGKRLLDGLTNQLATAGAPS
ncbi:MAG: SRPBCC family protein [Acidimicrobiales bacterium]